MRMYFFRLEKINMGGVMMKNDKKTIQNDSQKEKKRGVGDKKLEGPNRPST